MAFMAIVLKQQRVSVLFNPDTFVEGIIDDVILQNIVGIVKVRS
jgi:hypothetical protein